MDAAAADGGTATLDKAICEREVAVVECLRLLCKCRIDPSHAQVLIGRCVSVFKHETALFKWLPQLPALSGASPKLPSRYTALIAKLCGDESLCAAMYNLITYVGQMEADVKTAARAKKEARLIPDLVFAVDKFEAQVVTVGAKCKVDLLQHMKRATARDFRIQVTEVQTKLKMLEAQRREEERKRRDKEKEGAAKKRKREEDKGEKAAGKKAAGKVADKGGKALAAGKSGSKKAKVPIPAEPEDEEEDDDEGEEEGDEYPESMIDGEGSDVGEEGEDEDEQ